MPLGAIHLAVLLSSTMVCTGAQRAVPAGGKASGAAVAPARCTPAPAPRHPHSSDGRATAATKPPAGRKPSALLLGWGLTPRVSPGTRAGFANTLIGEGKCGSG